VKLVIIESPFRSTAERSQELYLAYLSHCIADSVERGEAPYASHGIMPLVLNDDDPADRLRGIMAGWEWGKHATLIAVYRDLGVSEGMKLSIKHYEATGKEIEWRTLPPPLVKSILDAA
jgi:hypothetical protein